MENINNFKKLLMESIKAALQEQGLPSPVPTPTPTPQTAGGTPPQAQPPTGQPEQQPGIEHQFNVDSMIEKMNIIRSGKSFEDPKIYGLISEFFQTIPDQEKDAVDKFLVELGRIVTTAQSTQEPLATQQAAPPNPPIQLEEGANKDVHLFVNGKEIGFGSIEHLFDLKRTLAGMERVRSCYGVGSGHRTVYSLSVGKLKKLIRRLEDGIHKDKPKPPTP